MSSDPSDNEEIVQNDTEVQQKKYPYPKSVFFIISNEFCERFSYYGMRTILTLYLINILAFSDKDATVIYHAFACLVYFFPVLGAIVCDTWLGKFNTIFYLSIVYAIGNILLALSSAHSIGLPQMPMSMVALFLIAVGTGGIKPCVSAFGGDQFKLPEQELQLATFFSLFYFSINAGSLISTFLTPILRTQHCDGEESCFPLAFAIPGVLMVVSIVIFGLGKPMYKIKKPQGNILVQVCGCIYHAATSKKGSENDWLDRSIDKYGEQMVIDVRATLKVLVLYIPLPVFWALYDQQGSVWTIQATQLDGSLGSFEVLPDQTQVVNPLLILLFIPMFTYGVYPLLAKCNFLKSPLQRMVMGGVLAAVAFGVSAVISTYIENGIPTLPEDGHVNLRLYNPTNDDYHIAGTDIDFFALPKFKNKATDITIGTNGTKAVSFTATKDGTTDTVTCSITFEEKENYMFYVTDKKCFLDKDNATISGGQKPFVRTLSADGREITYVKGEDTVTVKNGNYSLYELEDGAGEYKIKKLPSFKHTFEKGGIYTVMIKDNEATVVEVQRATTIHMFWQLPQYFIITAAEIMFSITGVEFSYSQAPVNMKSVLQAAFLLTTAIGDVIIIIIESIEIFPKQSYVLLLFAGLMILDMVLFAYLAYKYTYVQLYDDSEAEIEPEEPEEKKKISNGLENPAFKEANEDEEKN